MPPTLIEFVRNGAAGAWAPLLIAFLLEHIKPFQMLEAEAKKWTVLGLFVVLPVLAQVLLQYVPPTIWVELEPFWNALAIGFLGWAASQAAHMWDKQRQAQ